MIRRKRKRTLKWLVQRIKRIRMRSKKEEREWDGKNGILMRLRFTL